MRSPPTTAPPVDQASGEYSPRALHILDAAAAVIMRLGYDKATMSDIAEEAGVTRAIVYQHFGSKESLFEALLQRETAAYIQTWLTHIEADPHGGTIGSTYRAVLVAIDSRPFMAAMMRRDRRVIGSYLRKPNNLFASLQAGPAGAHLLRAMQAAGVVRRDVDPAVMGHVLDMLSYGLVSAADFKAPDEIPPFETVMETLAAMMDTLLTPAEGVDHAAGKALARRMAAEAAALVGQAGGKQEG